ncbi:DNA polymerase III subunit delta' [Roseateles sp. BYS180W]|uniref:DNA polymerase III subunit delta n=1 Tax=Roseateles rivi TaxID=3299028 RepID=A0ABW7FXP5_9BURK
MLSALPWLAAPLQQALERARGHALLLHGPEGVGQFELAWQLAKAWLCEARADAQHSACGHCPSCHLFEQRAHPDFQMLLPEALQEALGLSTESDGEGASGKSKAKPSREIKVEAVRQMLSFAQVSSARGSAKVVLVHPAEALNTVAANALLKTLEEPSGQLRFVLTSSGLEQVLPTIRSRCQPMALTLPPAHEALPWLQQQAKLEDAQAAAVLLAATGGRPQEALQWLEAGIGAQQWLALPRAIAMGQAKALQDWPLPRAVSAMQKLVHDLLCLNWACAPRYFPREALPTRQLRRQALQDWAQQLQQLARQAEHPWNAGLFLEALVAQGQTAMQPMPRQAAPTAPQH